MQYLSMMATEGLFNCHLSARTEVDLAHKAWWPTFLTGGGLIVALFEKDSRIGGTTTGMIIPTFSSAECHARVLQAPQLKDNTSAG